MRFLEPKMSFLKVLVTACVTVQLVITVAVLFTGSLTLQFPFNPQTVKDNLPENCHEGFDDSGDRLEVSTFEAAYDKTRSHKIHMFGQTGSRWGTLSQSRKVNNFAFYFLSAINVLLLLQDVFFLGGENEALWCSGIFSWCNRFYGQIMSRGKCYERLTVVNYVMEAENIPWNTFFRVTVY